MSDEFYLIYCITKSSSLYQKMLLLDCFSIVTYFCCSLHTFDPDNPFTLIILREMTAHVNSISISRWNNCDKRYFPFCFSSLSHKCHAHYLFYFRTHTRNTLDVFSDTKLWYTNKYGYWARKMFISFSYEIRGEACICSHGALRNEGVNIIIKKKNSVLLQRTS